MVQVAEKEAALDEAFSPDMLAEARAQMAAAGDAATLSSVVPATGARPHPLPHRGRGRFRSAEECRAAA